MKFEDEVKIYLSIGTNAPEWYMYEQLEKFEKLTLMSLSSDQKMQIELNWRIDLYNSLIDELSMDKHAPGE